MMEPQASTDVRPSAETDSFTIRENRMPKGVDVAVGGLSGVIALATETIGRLGRGVFDQVRNEESEFRTFLRETGFNLKPAVEILRSVVSPEKVTRSLEGSAHVWNLIEASKQNDGIVRAPDGTPLTAKYDSFEGLRVDVAGERTVIAICQLQGKKHILSLRDPKDPRSAVVHGNQGFDEIEAFRGVLIGWIDNKAYVVNPVTGGLAATRSVWTRNPSSVSA